MDPTLFPFLFNPSPVASQPMTPPPEPPAPPPTPDVVGPTPPQAVPVQPVPPTTVPPAQFAPPPALGANAQVPPGGGTLPTTLSAALQGVRSMSPQVQTVRTPEAPRPHAVNPGAILALLQSLGMGGRAPGSALGR